MAQQNTTAPRYLDPITLTTFCSLPHPLSYLNFRPDMDAISPREPLTLLSSLTGVLPFFSPLEGVILRIAEAVEKVSDNKNQCKYLLTRCADLCIHVHQLYLD